MSELKELSVEVYKDVARPAVSEVGAVVGRTAKALLSPIRGFLWCWEPFEQLIETEVQKRIEKIPEEQLKTPDPEIAVPLIQSLTYTAHNETLREMYIALLANSMDKAKENLVHPSYVEIIRKMNRLDALVFEKLAFHGGNQRVINPHLMLGNTGKYLVTAFPEWYAGWTIEGFTEFDVSASMVRLDKFGIIDLMYDRTIQGASYEDLKNTPFIMSVIEEFKKQYYKEDLHLSATESVVSINEFGKLFRKACQ